MSNEITTPYDRVLIDPNEPLILPDGTAITGRLETFLYALCCLDYDNLPTPLSRIEEFANALITGEIPNIEPQSRSEQFFLAILDGNIDNLPEPQSRSEVLLNKLAVGDFDLTNVDPIQSRYELLLAYLIKNGGVGNLDYVLYEFYQATQTLYNTQEKPVKGAILKGNTKYRDIDTGDILDTFDETKNLELVSVKMPVLTTTNGEPEFIEVDGEQVPNEAFKSNILTTSEQVELRGIGDVKDELNLITSELTQRIGEVVLNGNENWMLDTTTNEFLLYHRDSIPKSPLLVSIQSFNLYKGQGAIATKLKNTSYENIGLEEFKQYLSQNPITVNYQLATESVKTVDLSVIDQDGNVLPKIKTFNDTTHVNVSSDGILPKVEMEVATYNEEDIANANVMTASMDEIYSVQNELDNTNSIQSEEIDSTMIASTEIYENIL